MKVFEFTRSGDAVKILKEILEDNHGVISPGYVSGDEIIDQIFSPIVLNGGDKKIERKRRKNCKEKVEEVVYEILDKLEETGELHLDSTDYDDLSLMEWLSVEEMLLDFGIEVHVSPDNSYNLKKN